jgi:DNA-directed RNA polymerase I and III subunit RPAC2
MAEGEMKTALEMIQAAGINRHCVTFVLPKEDHILGNSLHSFYDLEEAGSGIL